jgi:hypothetical protein
MILFNTEYQRYKAGEIIYAGNGFAKLLREEGVAYSAEDTKLAMIAAQRAHIAPDNGRWMHEWLQSQAKKPIPDDRIASVEQIESIPNPPDSSQPRPRQPKRK